MKCSRNQRGLHFPTAIAPGRLKCIPERGQAPFQTKIYNLSRSYRGFKRASWGEHRVRAWFRRLLERYVIFSASCFILSQRGGSFCPPPVFVIPFDAEVTLRMKHVCVERFLPTCEPCPFRHGWIIIRSLHYCVFHPFSFTVSYEVARIPELRWYRISFSRYAG